MVEIKKNPKADLTKLSGLFLSIGLMLSLLFVITAFEWKFYEDLGAIDLKAGTEVFDDLMEVPQTEQTPPPPQKLVQPEIIEVEDDEDIKEEISIDLDIEMNETTVIQEVVFTAAPEEEEADEIFTIVEDQPTPAGGMQAFYKYVSDNLKYPAQARRMGIEGKVFVQFVVDRDGKLNEVQAVKGIGAGCDEEAVRVIQGAPKWNPGKQRGRPVRVRMILPITFKLG
jgi:periplasmic protein TonB